MEYLAIYLLIISFIAVVVTVYDKKASKKWTKHRTPENILLLLAFLGGSIAEFVTMVKIRHKTKHKKFMIGLPVIIILQIISILLLYYYI